jgi:hypothetical protein
VQRFDYFILFPSIFPKKECMKSVSSMRSFLNDPGTRSRKQLTSSLSCKINDDEEKSIKTPKEFSQNFEIESFYLYFVN